MLHTLKTRQFIKSDLNTVWRFISSPKNLALITPAYMGFNILDKDLLNEEMYAGQIIEYTVSPVLGIKLHWVTEITHVQDLVYFVDEQRMGPYAFWHHRHFLKEVPGGIEMTDVVHYKLPLGILGRILNLLFVRHKLKEIFDYRFEKLNEIFNK
ncbi:MAG: SRPBCC family protein [bacterium]|nr:SRPBCC family protein [bacterium]